MIGTARLAIGFAILAQPWGAMAQTPQLRPDQSEFRALYQELVETDTSATTVGASAASFVERARRSLPRSTTPALR
jgi:hypothetical protein